MRLARFALIASLTLALAPAAASAAVTQSQITSPGEGTIITNDLAAPSTINVTGTSDGTTGDFVDILCYWGFPASHVSPKTGVAVQADGSFSASFPASAVVNTKACMLRAVTGGTTPLASPMVNSPFAGPRIYLGSRQLTKVNGGVNDQVPYDFYIRRTQKAGYFDYYSTGGCGIDYSYVIDPVSLEQSNPLFWCNDWLTYKNGFYNGANPAPAGQTLATRGELQIDGRDAYTGWAAYDVPEMWGAADGSVPGMEPISVSDSVNAINGDLTITESQDVVRCSPGTTAFPPKAADCTSFAKAGVHVERKITQDHDGRMSTIVTTWSSTDGQPHEIDMQLENEQFAGQKDPGYKFPWVSDTFAARHRGETIPASPAGKPGTIFINAAMSYAEGTTGVRGAITFARPTDGIFFESSTPENGTTTDRVHINYKKTIPAGGHVSLAFSYINAFQQADTDAMAAEAEARFTPTLTLSGPVDGTTTESQTVNVTGKAGGQVGFASVEVNGKRATVVGDGSFAKELTLQPGANAIEVVATTEFGDQVTQKRSVTYNPPPAPVAPTADPATPSTSDADPTPAAKPAATASAPKISGRAVVFSVACKSPAGAPCAGAALLTVKGKSVGGLTFSVAAGKTSVLKVKLSKAAQRTLAKKHKLAVRLAIVQTDSGASPTNLLVKKLVFKTKRLTHSA